MQIIHWARANHFIRIQIDKKAEEALQRWRTAVLAAQWKDFDDLLGTFDSAQCLNGKIIFLLKGYPVRLTAVADFGNDKLYIREVVGRSPTSYSDYQ